ncbi:MAG: hypothetical protein FVQ85_14595 [Planctomycetes bacterium]|nr:hypothetical protein [Planctomycetota bacterium]
MPISVKDLLLSLVLIAYLSGSIVAQPQLVGDLNADYVVDFKDVQVFTWQWLDPACLVLACNADMDSVDGVNMFDLALLAQNWQKKCPPLVISEFMAINEFALFTTVEGKQVYPDWIEIYNPTAEAVNLDDWYLTDRDDELAKWEFPDVSIAPGNFLLVFASGIQSEDYPGNNPYLDEDGFYHTNFELDGDGEYLALVCPSLEVVHEYKSYENGQDKYGFPPQGKDISYGFYMNEPRYFTSSTPDYANNQGSVGISEGLWFSPRGGTFADPLSLVLTPKTPGAIIRYTINGSIPTVTSAQYTGPIPISDTTEVMARAFESGNAHGPVVSQTYVALANDARVFNSNIPIVVVDTYGSGIGQSSYTKASVVFIEPVAGGRVNITDQPDFAGRGGLKIRGSSTAGASKHQYSFETWDEYNQDKRVSIFGLAPDSDWILYAPLVYDRALINNPFIYELSNQVGRYAVRTRACELYLNTDGGKVDQSDYWGLYYFMEKIRINEDRVDIKTLEPWDSTEPKVTGGYILAIDRKDPDGDGFWTSRGTPNTCCGGRFVYVDPPEPELTNTQKTWLLNWLDEFEVVLYGPDFTDPQLGYAKYIDVDSHIDHSLLNVLPMNADAFRLSGYMYKGREGKLESGPIWDFDRAMESTDGRDDNPEVWYGGGGTDFFGFGWWGRFHQDINFWQKYIDRWYELRRDQFSTQNINNKIDTMADEVREAADRNYSKWSGYPPRFSGFQGEIDHMKDWLDTRATWIDSQFVKPPQLTPYGGYVEAGSTVSMSNPNGSGTIWYTLDGNDPRLPVGLQITGTTLVVEDALKKVLVPIGTVNDNWKGGGAFDDSGWNDGTFIASKTGGVGYDNNPDYIPYISYDVKAKMYNGNNSCYIRIPFTFNGDPCDFNFMMLYIRYDDGFIAYLNGDEIERINFPDNDPPLWNSNASNGHDTSGLEAIPVSDHLGSLKNGDNILAVQGLNISNTSSDFIISAELVAGEANSIDGISPSAIQYSGTVTLTKSTQVKARVLVASNPYSPWSGLADPTYGVGPVAENLRITEIMYHPQDTGDPNDPNTEFIELKNIGPNTLNLNLVKFTEGIHFTFPDTGLNPNECVIVVKDRSAFEAKYGTSVNIAGQYSGSLANNGERIKLEDAAGKTILDFEYKDGWRPIVDGDGFSLTIIEPIDSAMYGSDKGLVAHWKFDDGSGGTAIDSAGTNNGTLVGDPTWTTGRVDGALSLDGNGDYVAVAPIVSLAGINVTAQAWIRVDEFAGIWNPILTQHDLSNNGYYFYVSSGTPAFYIVGGVAFVQVISNEAINTNQWYHVAGTNDGSYLKLYVDGELKDSASSTGFLGANYNAYIGSEPTSPLYYTGLIDDVRVYNRAVSESEFQDIANPSGRWSRKSSWRASVYRNGTPGWDDSGILPDPGAVVINEVMSHSNAGPDWIELHNTTDESINIGNWFLSDNDKDEPNLMKYRIANGTTIAANSYLVFYQDTDFNNPGDPGSIVPFAFSENGEEACLSSRQDPNGMLTGYRDVEDFGAAQTNVSFGRYFKSSTDNFNFVAMDYNTPDANNPYPKVGPVVINEIMYNPPTGNQNEEYIELHNITGAPVTLYRIDKLTPWKFTDGIDYTFSDSPPVTIPAYGYLMVVKDLTSFIARYGSMPLGVQVVDDYDGRLSNGGERLQISMPGDIDGLGTRQYIRIDRVTYSDGWHPEDVPGDVDYWPTEADGLGKSLSRKVPTDYGNDVANWEAAMPSPGIANP